MTVWTYDQETKTHFLPTPDKEVYVFVVKSAAGDYYTSAMRAVDPAGGEIHYCDTLAEAKKFGEKIASNGTYVDYLI